MHVMIIYVMYVITRLQKWQSVVLCPVSWFLVWPSRRHGASCTVSRWTLLSFRTDSGMGASLSNWHRAESARSLQPWGLPALPFWYGTDIWIYLYILHYIFEIIFFLIFLNMFVSSAGMFCSSPGLSQPSGLCQAGFYCPAGSTSPNATGHANQVFCPSLFLCYFLWDAVHLV